MGGREMRSFSGFLRRAFPPKGRTALCGLGYGALLGALLWHPLPMLLKNVKVPVWAAGVLAAALACVLLWGVLSGRLLAKDRGCVGWTALGLLFYGALLAVWGPGRPGGALAGGLCLLAVHLAACAFRAGGKG